MGWGVFAGTMAKTGLKTYRDLEDDDREDSKLQIAKDANTRAQTEADRASRAEKDTRDAAGFGAGGKTAAPISDNGASSDLNIQPATKPAGLNVGAAPAGGVSTKGLKVDGQSDMSAPVGTEKGFDPTSVEGARARYQALRTPAALQMLQAAEAKATEAQKTKFDQGIRSSQLNNDTTRLSMEKELNAVRMRAANHDLNKADYDFAREQYTNELKTTAAIASGFEKVQDTKTSLTDPAILQTSRDFFTSLEKASRVTPDGKAMKVEQVENGFKVTEFDDKTGKQINAPRLYHTVRDAQEVFGIAQAFAKPGVMETYTLVNSFTKDANERPALRADYTYLTQLVGDRNQLVDPEVYGEAVSRANAMAAKDPSIEEEITDYIRDADGNIERDADGKAKTTRTKQNRIVRQLNAARPKTVISVQDPKTGDVTSVKAETAVAKYAAAVPTVLPKFGYDEAKVGQQMIQDLVGKGWEKETAGWIARKALENATVAAEAAAAEKAAAIRDAGMPQSVQQRSANPRAPSTAYTNKFNPRAPGYKGLNVQ